MVVLWLVGDLTKLVFYVINAQPVQFIFCAAFQITFDVLILAQFLMFRKTATGEKLPTSVQEV